MTTPCSFLKSDPTAHALCKIYNPASVLKQKSRCPVNKATRLGTVSFMATSGPMLAPKSFFGISLWNRRPSPVKTSPVKTSKNPKPWEIQNPALRRRLKSGVKYLVRKLKRKRRWKTKKAFNTALAREIIIWVTLSKHRGGLGLRPLSITEDKVWRQRTAEQVLLAKTQSCPKKKKKKPCGEHCVELNNVFYPIFKMAGLKPKHLFVFKHASGKVSLDHVCIGIQVDPSQPNDITQIDLSLKRTKWLGKFHKVAFPITSATMMSIHLSNKAVTLYRKHKSSKPFPQKIAQEMRTYFAKALRWDAKNPQLLYVLASYHLLVEYDENNSVLCLNEALKSHPTYKEARDLLKRIKRSRATSTN